MKRLTLASIVSLCGMETLAPAQAPGLHLEYTDQEHKRSLIGPQPIRAPSNESIALTLILEPAPPGSRLRIQADYQPPGDLENPPPANINFVVRNVQQNPPQAVPFKVTSSGGGFDVNRAFVLADLNILGDPRVRHAKLRELASRWIAEVRKAFPGDPDLVSLSTDPEGLDRVVRVLDDAGAVCMPPGTYEITVVYTAKPGGELTSEPARFVIFEAANSKAINQPQREPPK